MSIYPVSQPVAISRLQKDDVRDFDENTCRTPPQTSAFLATEGPTPERLIRVRDVPTTEKRQTKRLSLMLKDLNDEQRGIIEQRFALLAENAPLQRAMHEHALPHRMEAVASKYRKKCYTLCQVVILEQRGDEYGQVGFEELDELFWSSSKQLHTADLHLVGVDPKRVRSSSGQQAPFPLADFHAERACLGWLSENIHLVVARIFSQTKEKISWHTVIHINMITRYSSCRNCSLVFGTEENFSRIPNSLQQRLFIALDLLAHQRPHVTLLHQGMQHHHPQSKGDAGSLPMAELFCSSSFLDVI